MTEEKYPPKMEKIIEFFDQTEKPWFLSTAQVYRLVKSTAASLPLGQGVFEQSLNVLSVITKYVNDNTQIKIVLDSDKAHELIDKLDTILSEQLIVLDDGLDDARAKLASSLRQLLVAIVNHKKWAENQAEAAKDTTIHTVKTRYEQALAFVSSLVQAARERMPLIDVAAGVVAETAAYVTQTQQNLQHTVQDIVQRTTEEGLHRVHEAREMVDAKVVDTVHSWLTWAQPYVHLAVKTGAPYVHKALSVSQPYVIQAKPYVEPLVVRANEVTTTLKENKVVGKYVESAVQIASTALDQTKSFVLPPEEQERFEQLLRQQPVAAQ